MSSQIITMTLDEVDKFLDEHEGEIEEVNITITLDEEDEDEEDEYTQNMCALWKAWGSWREHHATQKRLKN